MRVYLTNGELVEGNWWGRVLPYTPISNLRITRLNGRLVARWDVPHYDSPRSSRTPGAYSTEVVRVSRGEYKEA